MFWCYFLVLIIDLFIMFLNQTQVQADYCTFSCKESQMLLNKSKNPWPIFRKTMG